MERVLQAFYRENLFAALFVNIHFRAQKENCIKSYEFVYIAHISRDMTESPSKRCIK